MARVEDEGGLADQVTAWQVMRWAEYGQCEPWGEERADLRAGIIAATMANTVRNKSHRPYRPADFMARFEKKPDQDPAEMKATIMAYLRQVAAMEKR